MYLNSCFYIFFPFYFTQKNVPNQWIYVIVDINSYQSVFSKGMTNVVNVHIFVCIMTLNTTNINSIYYAEV